jgi:predicted aspartyl protease
MGLTKVTVCVSALSGEGDAYEGLFLVDTGSTDSMAPGDRLAAIGIEPEGKCLYELASGPEGRNSAQRSGRSGEAVEYEYGFAKIAFMGEKTVCPIILGPSDSEPLLGAVALESVGIMVDPVTRTLKRLPAKPLK